MIVQTRTDSQLVVTSPHTDQVLIYDLDEHADDPVDWLVSTYDPECETNPSVSCYPNGSYPYIFDPVKTINLDNEPTDPTNPGLGPGDWQPGPVDVASVTDGGNQVNRAFMILKGTEQFVAMDLSGANSGIIQQSLTDLGISSNPQAVAIADRPTGPTGEHYVYFALQDSDLVLYADAVSFSLNPVNVPDTYPPEPATIHNPIEIAFGMGTVSKGNRFGYLLDIVQSIPISAFSESTSRDLLLSAIESISANYNDSSPSGIETTIRYLMQAWNLLVHKTDPPNELLPPDVQLVSYYREKIFDELEAGLRDLIDAFVNDSELTTSTEIIEILIENLPLTSFNEQNFRIVVSQTAHQATIRVIAHQYDRAIQELESLRTILDEHLKDHRMLLLMRDVIEDARNRIMNIVSRFDQAAEMACGLSSTVSGLPSTSFRNNGARQSLLAHISQLEQFCGQYNLSSANQKVSQVQSDIQSNVTDSVNKELLIETITEIVGVLEQIGG